MSLKFLSVSVDFIKFNLRTAKVKTCVTLHSTKFLTVS